MSLNEKKSWQKAYSDKKVARRSPLCRTGDDSLVMSEYLVIQVQEGIKSHLQIVLHALTVVSGNVVSSSLISCCIHGVLLGYQKGLIY